VHDVYFGPNGIVHGIQSETIVVDCSTIGPKAAVAVSEKLRPYNVDFLDAPITGGDIGAKEASLVFMVGGDAVRFWEIESLLGHMGKTSYHCGAVGSGQSMKLVNQLLCGVNMLAVAEAIQLTKEMRIDPKLMIEICAGGAGGSWALKHLGPRIVQSELQSGFKVAHMLKDLNLVIDAVGKTAALPALSLAQQHFSKLATMNGGQFNSYATQAIALLYDDSSR
jgi:3-hydroxyisobutyrate dehydrogenase